MRRRNVLAAFGCAASGCARRARSHRPYRPRGASQRFAGRRQIPDRTISRRAGRHGNHDERNCAIAYRWAEGRNERLSALAAELINLPVAVLATLYGSGGALAAKKLTASIPIVFQTGGDAVALGLRRRLEQAGG